jgi:hypothetical protein
MQLQDSAWLAKRLGVSITTIERLRARGGNQLPPFIMIGNPIKFDESVVEIWIKEKQKQQQLPPDLKGEAS